jgi:hypothetical protein
LSFCWFEIVEERHTGKELRLIAGLLWGGIGEIGLQQLGAPLGQLVNMAVRFAYLRLHMPDHRPNLVFADEAVALLHEQGYTAYRLTEGLPDWRAQGYPVAVENRPGAGV